MCVCVCVCERERESELSFCFSFVNLPRGTHCTQLVYISVHLPFSCIYTYLFAYRKKGEN